MYLSKFGSFLIIISCWILHTLDVYANPSVDDFSREMDYRGAKLSPSGRYLAEVWNISESNSRGVTIRDLTLPGGAIIGKMFDEVVRPKNVYWANDERLLVEVAVPYNTKAVIRDSKKKDFNIYDYYMFSRMVSVDVHAQNPVVLFEDERRIRSQNINLSIIRHFLPNDPQHILMAAFKSTTLSLFKVNVYTGTSELVVRGSRHTYGFLSDRDGNPRFRMDYKPIGKTIEIFDLKGEKDLLIEKIKLAELDEDEFYYDALLGLYENKLIYRKINESTGYLELWTYDSKTKQHAEFVSLPNQDVLYPIADLRSDEIVGYAVDGDVIRYKYFDNENQAFYDELANKIGLYNFNVSSWSDGGSKVVVRISGLDNPTQYNLFDQKTGAFELLSHAYSGIKMDELSLPGNVTYATRDGQKIKSYILLPKDYQKGKRYPLVVLPHGGPQARDRASYDNFAQFISTRGYIVIKPNFRGSTGYGKSFMEAGFKQWGKLMQDDLTDAVTFMVKKGYADPNKVCIVGASYGGYAALIGAIKNPEIYRCAVSLNGVTDLIGMIKYEVKQIQEPGAVEKYIYQRMGNPKDDKSDLESNSPVKQVSKVKVPLLIVAGREDKIVPFEQSKTLFKLLKKQKKDVQFVELKNTGHNIFYYRDDMNIVYAEVETFLKKYLN